MSLLESWREQHNQIAQIWPHGLLLAACFTNLHIYSSILLCVCFPLWKQSNVMSSMAEFNVGWAYEMVVLLCMA